MAAFALMFSELLVFSFDLGLAAFALMFSELLVFSFDLGLYC
jgi:hypothetical protein